MTGSALTLTLAAALLHAGWNLLLAGARDVLAATAVALVASVLVAAPAAALTWDVETDALPYAAGSAALELAYFFALTAAYTRSDLSLVYPVARGGAPVLVLLGALALGRLPSGAEAGGVLLVGAGVLLVRGLRSTDPRGLALGAAIAVLIAGYTTVDNAGIEHASPIAYLELVLLPVALAVLLAVPRERLRAAIAPAPVAAGIASFAAYALVLAALDRAPAAPVAAVRETSVVIAVALAAIFLHERVGPARLAGAIVVAGGVALLSF
ncbi:MAG: EamA family transporter [Gaiellaceae bacterium]